MEQKDQLSGTDRIIFSINQLLQPWAALVSQLLLVLLSLKCQGSGEKFHNFWFRYCVPCLQNIKISIFCGISHIYENSPKVLTKQKKINTHSLEEKASLVRNKWSLSPLWSTQAHTHAQHYTHANMHSDWTTLQSCISIHSRSRLVCFWTSTEF